MRAIRSQGSKETASHPDVLFAQVLPATPHSPAMFLGQGGGAFTYRSAATDGIEPSHLSVDAPKDFH